MRAEVIFLIYRFYGPCDNMRPMTERHSRSVIHYYSKKTMHEMYSNGGYEIIGEISNITRKYKEQDMVVSDTGKHIPIFPRGSAINPMEWTAGYARIGENIYVAVIKSVIPFLLFNDSF